MNDPRPHSTAPVQLPRALIDRIAPPFIRFLHIEAAGGAVLLTFTIAALLLSNSPWADAFFGIWETRIELRLGEFEFGRSLKSWINDGLMTLFFFLVALELKREAVLGEMRNPRMAALSIAAALGGMVAPASVYLALQWAQPGQHGWGIVMATDTAFVIACLALLGKRIPHSLRVFMLFLAIVDDIGAILVVAVGYSQHMDWRMLALAGLCIGILRGLAAAGIRSIPIYVIAGCATWLAIDASGLHATVTGVILGLMTPARRWVSDSRLYAILGQVIAHPTGNQGSAHTSDRGTLQVAEIAARESLSPVERLEMALHPWVSFCIMPIFALANAGLALSWTSAAQPVAAAVFLGFAIGKPTGILLFSWLALRSGLAIRPPDLNWGSMAGGSFLAGIGFTMALFIANLALVGPLMDSAKIGIFLASLFSAVVGLALLVWLPRPQTLDAKENIG
ncbi:Na+/H+ antiporter NhaA [Diaphorobacter sp. C33]|uniref:Na(+)/H(+) antiporter NhaA n=1 Tax=Diaphorobacter nitroreducens TaxID=164759 RepID=A0AAX1WRX1_9BURK|nr:Na+/H+ antiporter NhaA [Diaphorobacter sp. C33]ROR40365.1 sodium/proton antiporter (NhaA family) [Diaphorobacter nitroreducens]WKK90132.1 Na+/H+ antiporter NhaA [Diaphorobacter sp. C33]